MTKLHLKLAPLGIALLLLMTTAVQAHPSPDPRSFETRLLHDCVDDVPGSHDGINFGYDLHSLDVWEFWHDSHQVGFRVILNGASGGTLTLTMEVAGTETSWSWTSQDGNQWTSENLNGAKRSDDVYLDSSSEPMEDGQRFALVGHVNRSTIGASGTVLSNFAVAMDSGLDDAMPGAYNGGECDSGFERPDYTIGELGPSTGYISDPISDDTAAPDADTEELVDIRIKTKVKSLRQSVDMRIVENTGDAVVTFHDPDSGEYTDASTVEVAGRGNPGSERLVHLSIRGPADAAGTVTVELVTQVILKDGTTQPGGRIQDRIAYAVDADEVTPPPPVDNGDTVGDESNETPVPSMAVASVVLLVATAWRRR